MNLCSARSNSLLSFIYSLYIRGLHQIRSGCSYETNACHHTNLTSCSLATDMLMALSNVSAASLAVQKPRWNNCLCTWPAITPPDIPSRSIAIQYAVTQIILNIYKKAVVTVGPARSFAWPFSCSYDETTCMWCSVFLPTPNDSSIVMCIHCIKADLNVKL